MAGDKTYEVTATLVTARTKNNRIVYLYKGDVVTQDVTDESVTHLLDLGFIAGRDEPEAGDQPAEGGTTSAAELKGKALDEALRDAGLATDGKADEKRARLAEFEASQHAGGPADTDEGDEPEPPAEPEAN